MVISDQQKQAFCHIPKNGGSSLRRYFADLWDDARVHHARNPVAALDGEVRDLNHLTVEEARLWFGEELVDKGYRVTAVLRPIESRLRSALYHYLRVMHPDEKEFLSTEKALALLGTVSIAALCERSGRDLHCVYFRPQTSYIETVPDAQRDLVLMSELDARFPGASHVNRAGKMPAWLRRVDSPLTRRVAGALGAGLKRQLRSALTRRDERVERAIDEFLRNEEPFWRAFYAEDEELLAKVAVALDDRR